MSTIGALTMLDADRLQLCVDCLETSLAERTDLGLPPGFAVIASGDSAQLIRAAGQQRSRSVSAAGRVTGLRRIPVVQAPYDSGTDRLL